MAQQTTQAGFGQFGQPATVGGFAAFGQTPASTVSAGGFGGFGQTQTSTQATAGQFVMQNGAFGNHQQAAWGMPPQGKKLKDML